jgi:putative spermidine/putrescine transport system ATP-binding protein
MVTSPHLILDGLTAHYGDTLAVDALTLKIGKGELVALLGPSGCGKTTTLRMVAGFVKPTGGKVILGGRDLTRVATHKRNTGVVFQSYALFPHLTVLENVGFGLRMRHVPTDERRRRARASLDMVGLAAVADRYPAQLSGGQQQRVALARALVIEPDVLLLDEPLSNLDANLRAEMRGEIRRLQQTLQITALFVTHDQEEALAMSDRIAVMSAGRLVEVGTPMTLSDAPNDPFTAQFLGSRTIVEGTTRAGVFTAPGLTCAGAPGDATRLVLRAARLQVEAPGGTLNGPLEAHGQVAATAFIGDLFETDVETPSGTIRVLVPSQTPPPPPGSPCRVTAMPGGVSFMT